MSIDGLAPVHDGLRGVPGSFDAAFRALRGFRGNGLSATVNTQINSLNIGQLRELFDAIAEAGATGWQVQLTVPMGEAADRPELIIQPHRIPELMRLLADLFVEGQRRGLRLLPGNNIGYFGPYEALWRSVTGEAAFYAGCGAGRIGLGIEADGAIKGCPSLPTRSYVGGNVRDQPLRDIWEQSRELAFMRNGAGHDRLWGFCGTCYYSRECQAGCSWTTQVVSGRPGNNPFCHHRALDLARRGLRESIRHRRVAEGVPFDHGEFDIVLEDAAGAPVADMAVDSTPRSAAHEGHRLRPCRRCAAFVRDGIARCPFCEAGQPTASSHVADRSQAFEIATERLLALQDASRGLASTVERLAALADIGASPASTAPATAAARERGNHAQQGDAYD